MHDIGKNLVDIILTNNGYRVVNLGIKQPGDTIIRAAQEHKADAIGLSGLLVKSTLEMKYVIQDLQRQALEFPVICGGAALTRKYVEDDLRREYANAVFYADDAFAGLHIMEDLATPNGQKRGAAEGRPDGEGVRQGRGCGRRNWSSVRRAQSAVVTDAPNIPVPPFWGVRVRKDFDLRELFPVHQRNRAVQEPVAVEDCLAGRLSAAGGGEVPSHQEEAGRGGHRQRDCSSRRWCTDISRRRPMETT